MPKIIDSREFALVIRDNRVAQGQSMSGNEQIARRARGGSALMTWGTSPDWTQRQNFFSAETRTMR